MRITFTDKLSKTVPQSETKAKVKARISFIIFQDFSMFYQIFL